MSKFIVVRVFRQINSFFRRIALSVRISSVIHSFKGLSTTYICFFGACLSNKSDQITLVLISAPHVDYYSGILHLKSICITVIYIAFILINTRNMISYIVIIYYEPRYKICIYFLMYFWEWK